MVGTLITKHLALDLFHADPVAAHLAEHKLILAAAHQALVESMTVVGVLANVAPALYT